MLAVQKKFAQSIKAELSGWRADRKALTRLRKYGSNNEHSRAFFEYWQSCRRDSLAVIEHTQVVDEAVESFTIDGISSWHTKTSRSVATKVYRYLLNKEKEYPTCWDTSWRYKEDILHVFPEIENIFDDSLSEFLYRVYGTHFKVFYGALYKSAGTGTPPSGSALWHRDGGPGTCINVMYGLSPLTRENGALMCISKKHTTQLVKEQFSHMRKIGKALKKEGDGGQPKSETRNAVSEHIDRIIESNHRIKIIQPVGESGLIIPFSNNVFHRGGNPKLWEARYVAIFHLYPSKTRPDWDKYRQNGVKKTGSYPMWPESS